MPHTLLVTEAFASTGKLWEQPELSGEMLRKLAIVLGLLAFMVFGLLPLAINMITGEYPLSTAIAMNAMGLMTIVIPIVLILGAVPVTTAMVANSKREKRIREQGNERDDEN